jgi:hypothetical protein
MKINEAPRPAVGELELSNSLHRTHRQESSLAPCWETDPEYQTILGHRVAELMIGVDLGVSTTTPYAVERSDSDYFNEE